MTQWCHRFITAIARWRVTLYTGGQLRDLSDMLEFFAWLDEGSRQLLDRWSGDRLLLDASATPLDLLATTVLVRMRMRIGRR